MAVAPYHCVKKGDPGEIRSRNIVFDARAKKLCGIEPGSCGIHCHGGPVMAPDRRIPADDVRFEPIAFYGQERKPDGRPLAAGDAGKIAIAVGSVGKGRMFSCAVHPESIFNDNAGVIKGAFKYVTGRDVKLDLPDVLASKKPKAAFVTFDAYGIPVAETILQLAKHKEFTVVPVAVSKLSQTDLDKYAVVVFPDGIGSVNRDKEAAKLLKKNEAKLKAFLSRGGSIVAWGRGAAHLEKTGLDFIRAKDGDDAAGRADLCVGRIGR